MDGDRTMVRTMDLCLLAAAKGTPCVGWAVHNGIEIRCNRLVHYEREIETTRAAILAGITYRRLDHWITCGWVVVDEPSPGSGRPRRLTEHEAAVVHLMARLVRTGIAPVTASRLSRALWNGEEARLTDALVVGWRPLQESLREMVNDIEEEVEA